MHHTQLHVLPQAEALPLANTMEVLFIMSYIFTHANSTLNVHFTNKVICCMTESQIKCYSERKCKHQR